MPLADFSLLAASFSYAARRIFTAAIYRLFIFMSFTFGGRDEERYYISLYFLATRSRECRTIRHDFARFDYYIRAFRQPARL